MKSIKLIASSVDSEDQEKSLEKLKCDFSSNAVDYFLSQWWENGQCGRWAEIHIRNYLNFGISTTSRVEGSHGAIKGALTSSSGTLYTAGKKLNRRGIDRAQQLSVIGSTQTLFVRQEIRNQIETSKLCTAISRSALELVYGEVVKKLHQQEDEGSRENCGCSTWNRYLLPCSHRIELAVPISITDIHPRWWVVHPEFSPVNVEFQHIDAELLLDLKDPAAALPRKGRPKGTRRLKTSSEAVQIATDRIEKARRCGSCKNSGHNRRKCPKLSSNLTTTENETTSTEQDVRTTQQLVASDDADSRRGEGFEEMWSDVFSVIEDGM
ncbi:uncharacterized protein V1513DRAFT_454770 [Lipomyces chichibuensis]|uniref:uncharacterized protein n=1 Tax=Lipomyces chichibuensis TaxID=1546026 RepID=UPI0033436385